MISKARPRQSLKTRITLATLLIFLASLWSLTFYSSQLLRQDMERQLGEQQFSTLGILAAQLDRELASRIKALETVAARSSPAMQGGPAALQRFIERHPTLQSLFNGGIIALDRAGTVLADVPLETGRTGVNLSERDSIASALNEGKTSVGELVMGKKLAAPIFHITAPIRDNQGRVIGALSGVTHLGRPNFLDQTTEIGYGKTGGYLLAAPQQRLIISATDKRRVMESLPAPGANPGLDRMIDGVEGYAVFVNPQGNELLASSKAIAATGWYVAAGLPVAEAFAPIREMQQRMLWATLALTLLAGWLVWWMLKRQLSPMLAAVDLLATMTDAKRPLRALPVTSHDEIGQLIGGFNQLLGTLGKREETLRESEALQGTLLANLLAGVIIVDPATRTIESANPAAAAMFGAPAQQIIGKRCHAFLCPAAESACPILDLGGSVDNLEKQMLCADGSRRTVLKSVTRIQLRGQEKLLECFVDINARKQAEDEIRQLAFYDPLTLLPNRRLLLDRLQQALAASSRHRNEGALLYIDLDNFKTLNDTRGHNVGDLLLKQVAKRLLGCVREGDTVARFGGDEFVVMLEDLGESPQEAAAQAKTVGTKILGFFERNFDLAGFDHHCTASIGITLFADRQETIDDLLKQADLSMYQSKAAGRNSLHFFNQQMQAAITERTALEADLSEALQKRQLMLYYQAQVSGERRLFGAEALLRWQHPRRGQVSPAEFIPLAEDTGLILPLGNWVLKTACTQLARWARQPAMAQLTVAVNVSVRQFHQPDFVEQVLSALEHSGANPQRLKLELTETVLASNIEDIIAKMTLLKARGVGFSLDDFGTGYSSLAYLKRLPLDQLKIDQSFVRDCLVDPNDAAIAGMVVALAGSLGLKVIAEGVENEAQRRVLAGQGCHDYQGYLFSRPLPHDEFEQLAKRSWTAQQAQGDDARALIRAGVEAFSY
jgi:diguanylate cyclase (GGDEF)-like protein/PAS domain S-box-containing protein